MVRAALSPVAVLYNVSYYSTQGAIAGTRKAYLKKTREGHVDLDSEVLRGPREGISKRAAGGLTPDERRAIQGGWARVVKEKKDEGKKGRGKVESEGGEGGAGLGRGRGLESEGEGLPGYESRSASVGVGGDQASGGGSGRPGSSSDGSRAGRDGREGIPPRRWWIAQDANAKERG